MDTLLQVPRLRITRHSQLSLSPLDDDFSRTPTAGPSRLNPHDGEDTEDTPRIPISSSLPSIYAAVDDTPAARLRALLAQVPNTSSASRTQLLHEQPPPLPSDRDSDFDPPPKWANSSTTSSARENLKSLFTHALREPGDTPRKDARRNSIDSSEVEDSPRIDRVIQERSRNKGKRMSFSDEELESSSKMNTHAPASHAANMETLRNRILGTQSDASMSLASDFSADNAALIREMHGHTASAPRISSTSLHTVHLSTQFQSQSNLLDQDSEMQRAMGVADSFDVASSNQAPSPQIPEPSLASRSRSSLVRAGSLTETKLTTNVSRQSEGSQVQRRRYDSLERPTKLANGVVVPSTNASSVAVVPTSTVPSTPPRERRDSYHHHRTSHSLTGSPLPQEFPRQRHSPAQSGGSRSSSRTGSTSSLADFRDRMNDTEKERHYERERTWNMPVSARSRTTSNTSSTGLSTRPGLEQSRVVRSREHSRPSSPSESVRSRATEDEAEVGHERKPNSASPLPTRNQQQQRQRPASPRPGPSLLRMRTQSSLSKPINSDTHTTTPAQSRLRRNPSQSSLTSEGSSRPSSPAELAHRLRAGHQDEEVNNERERNWGSRQQKWTHSPTNNKRATSSNLASHSRVRTQSLESDSSAPAMSTLGRPLVALSKRQPGELSSHDSDESMQDALTPIACPIEIPAPEKIQSPSRAESLHMHAEHLPNVSVNTPSTPISPRLDAAPSLELSTPLRRPSFNTSKIEFQTPSPPKGLPELPGPPSEDDTGNIDTWASRKEEGLPNLTITKTPRPPGAWAATPAPVPAPARSQTPQPITSSIRSRTRSNSLPQPSFTEFQSSVATPTPHVSTLPSRTPAPPGGWFSTPGSLRRKNLLKVRFEAAPSDSTASDADATIKDGVSLPEANWDITSQSQGASESMSEPSFNNVDSSSPAQVLSISASGDRQKADDPVANSPADPDNGTTLDSLSRRRLRRTPSVRLVDEYGRAQEDFPSTPLRKDVREQSASLRMPGGGPLKTPRNASVRIVDAMGQELEEPSEQNDSEDTVTETRYTRQEALERIKRAIADLREGLDNVDVSGSGSLDDPRLSELYDLSKAARDMRTKLASSLEQAQTAQIRHKYGSLKESMRKRRFLPNFIQESSAISWNHWLFWGFCSLQFIIFLVMYRMSKIYARHQFLTTYFDPFYADLHLHPTKPEFIYDTNLFSFLRRASMDPSLLERLGIDGPMYQFKRSIADVVAQAQRYIWESWGTSIKDQVTAWPPT